MTSVAIIGTGLLGRGIAGVVLRAGFPVILHDSFAASLSSAHQQLSEMARTADISVRAETELEKAVAGADFVIEAVIENLDLKQQVFERLGKANANAILMSNSSVLPIGQIAARTAHPERTVGTHWWNPPQLIPVVEVIRGPYTSEAVMRRTAEFLTKLGKTAVRVERDVPGFVGNRLQHALWREALALVSDAVTEASNVDRIIAATLGQTLAQRGPIAEMRQQVLQNLIYEFEATLPLINSDSHPASLLREHVARGELGAKSGQGFLRWPQGARERTAARLQSHVESRLKDMSAAIPARAHTASPLNDQEELIARRLRIALWREALSLIADSVCDAATVDLMAMNTIGLRLATLGPIENADYVGLDLTLAIHEAVLPSLNASPNVPPLLLSKASDGKPLS